MPLLILRNLFSSKLTSWREKRRRRIRSRTSCGKLLPAKAASSSRLWKLPSPLLAVDCRASK